MILDVGLRPYKGLSKDVLSEVKALQSHSFLKFCTGLALVGALVFYTFIKIKNSISSYEYIMIS